MITGELKSQIDKIWNDFWTGGISNPMTVIEQFTFLIFLKQLDDKQLKKEKKATLMGLPITKPIYTAAQKPLRFSSFKNQDPEVMFNLFTQPQRELDDLTAFSFMKTLGEKGGVFSEYMQGAMFMIPNARLLDKVIQQIDTLPLDNRDTKGDLYEYMLGKIAEAGTNGQFRTPRHIIKMMVAMTKPTQQDVICDPSCGTAGFLVAAGEYVYDYHQDWFNDSEFRNHFNSNMFNGLEFDPTMLRIGSMNLQLHGIETPQLTGVDSLSNTNQIENKYSLVLANPPFKGSLDYDDVENSLLKITKTKKTELLFLSLMLRMMKLGGRAAVIVPDGVLFGSSNAHKSIREELVNNQKLEAVISMPSGVFKPYAGVSTAILFFTKTNSGGTNKVWFYDMKADGLSLDDKRNLLVDEADFNNCFTDFNKFANDPNFTAKCDIPKILQEAEALLNVTTPVERPDRTSQSFLVPLQEIEDNDWDLSINRYKEIVYEEIEYAAPSEIIKDIETLDKERNQALEKLKQMLR
jgi:type I restriction enzyme M protein